MSAWIELDRASLLVHVPANVSLYDLERALADEGLAIGVEPAPASSVAAWLEAGAPGARNPWLDPADHLVAGFSARIKASGDAFVIQPAPRRAVGPDLGSVLTGLRGRFLTLDSVWFRVHRADATRPKTAPFESTDDEEPPF